MSERRNIAVLVETRKKVRLLAATLGVNMAEAVELAVAKLLDESTPGNASKSRPNDRA